MRSKKIIQVILLATAFLVGARSAPSIPAASLDEEAIKAAYVFNFLQFVEWPAESEKAQSSKVVIGVLAQDPYADVLEENLKGKTIQEKPVVVQRLTNTHDAARCHAIFFGLVEDVEVGHTLFQLRRSDVLTVGDMNRFAQRGGMIGFRQESNRIRFDINMRTAARANLKISSNLLKLARVVIGAPSSE